MKYYARLDQNNRVIEIASTFNDYTIEQIYSADFLADCVECDENTEQNMLYNPQTKTFSEYLPSPEEVKNLRIAQIKATLHELDQKTIRPQRAILADTATNLDHELLANLEDQAIALRQELADLGVIFAIREQ